MRKGDLDFNLLKAFHALYQERNVTRAAARLRLTQPAMSSALARLRTSLGDPLFIRTQQGMVPTARAKAMEGPVQAALAAIQTMIAEDTAFSPLTSTRAFRIMATDHALSRLARVLGGVLTTDAPRLQFDVSSVAPESDYERLRSGDTDLMVSFIVVQPPPSFKTTKLFSERHVVLARVNHPSIKSKLTLQEFVAADHVLIAPRGSWVSGPTDHALAQRGLSRQVRMAIPHYLVAPSVVAHSDMIVTVPESVADAALDSLPVAKHSLPFDSKPFTVTMVWHDRHHSDPAHRWLRGHLKAACRSL